jgi:hypothetical protein
MAGGSSKFARNRLFLAAVAVCLTFVLFIHSESDSNRGDASPVPETLAEDLPHPAPSVYVPPPAAKILEERKSTPNIIIVLSESLWDLTSIPNIKFSRDPLAFLHSLQQTAGPSRMLSPQFGGGTANVEFEVLTANSSRFLYEDTLAYVDYMTGPIDSLASILARKGYVSTAISPNDNWELNSRNVYKWFGFSRFISLEYFDPDEYIGPYIGDRAVARRIFEETERSPGADFVFANTMENHYHYWPGKFKENTISVTGKMTNESKGLLETYAQGAQDADKLLQSLVEHYSRSNEPTILVFFGDHLPFLEDNDMVYRDTGYLQDNDPDYLEKMHRVPLVVWSNYLPAPAKPLYFSPSALGPYVLHMAGLEGTAYTDFVYQLSQKIPLIPPLENYEAMHIDPEDPDLVHYQETEDAILTGDLTVYGDDKDRIVDENFSLGYGDPIIRAVVPAGTDRTAGAIEVQGGRFGIGSVVYADGVKLETVWNSESSLTAKLPVKPAGQRAAAGELQVEVRVIDSNGDELGRSNSMAVPASSGN